MSSELPIFNPFCRSNGNMISDEISLCELPVHQQKLRLQLTASPVSHEPSENDLFTLAFPSFGGDSGTCLDASIQLCWLEAWHDDWPFSKF